MSVLDRAAGAPNYHGTFIPELWVPEIQMQFEKRSTFQDISTNKYEKVISNYGDTVNINIEPDVTIRDYTKQSKLESESPEPSTVVLEINKAHYFRILVDDIDKAQSQPDIISMFAESGGKRMREKIDQTVLRGIYNSEDSNNSGATAGADDSAFNLGASSSPIQLDATNIYEYITDIGTVLDQQSVPDEDRWIVLPPAFINLLLKSDLKDASFTGDGQSIALNGKYHRKIAGFNIYQSRQLYSVTDGGTAYYCPAGHKSALVFANQLINTRAIEAQDTFGTYIDALHVYGYKVVRDEALAILYARRA